ncbi:PSD1 and planctomycete cytochrome C domain-containing protein [Isosphaeraceae bacterium EP7]
MHALRLTVAIGVLGLLGRATAGETPVFERDVRPIFKAYCLDCHGGTGKPKGKLDLRLKRLAERGGRTGAGLVAGQPDDSLLLMRMQDGEMPPGEKKVPPEQIAIIERWIAAGAVTSRVEPENLPPGIDITPEDRAFWAFQPISKPVPPEAKPEDRVRTPIDAFLVAKLKEKGLAFSPEADRLTLIRRASADLTGLVPSQESIDAYLADTSPDAYERMIDALLESPRYGERWARHWLDVAGYADSDGNGGEDTPRPYAYKYRDYVIRSLNADKPLDRFIIEQMAGDELVPRPWTNLAPDQAETLAATGYLRTAVDATTTGSPDEPLASNQVVADTLKIVSSSLLGLTVGCAQCHDHRYDPIPQSDYFRLRAVFEPALDPNHWRRPGQRLVSLYHDADRARSAAIEAEAVAMDAVVNAKVVKFLAAAFDKHLTTFPEAQRAALKAAYEAPADKRTEEQKALLAANPSANISEGVLYQYNQPAADELKKDREKVAAKRAEKTPEDFVSVVDEVPGVVPETKLFHRGDHRQPLQTIEPGDLTIAAEEGKRFDVPPKDPSLPTSGRRLAYARHLMNGTHPLVNRVLANRIWFHHFERGLVDSPGDFGVLGRRPSHPELLDWLAGELPNRGWSLKAIHRLIMTSTAYRQTSRRNPAQDAVDQDNILYGRAPLRRLDAESMRDRILAVSGQLDLTQFGPPVAVSEDIGGQVMPAGDSARRSIYLQSLRTKPVSFLAAFDAPIMAVNCDRRTPSTSSMQSLMLMNSDFILKRAGMLARRLAVETPVGYAAELTASRSGQITRPASAWQYGHGPFDEASQRITGFTPMAHWSGTAWQGGASLPDAEAGWSMLTSGGGHAGNDAQHATIRRWVAPAAGFVAVSGKLKHGGATGDGVRARVVSSRAGLLGTWRATRGEAATDVPRIEVQAGDTIDFAVDCVEGHDCDTFEWAPKVTLSQSSGDPAGVWDASADFQGPMTVSIPQMIAHAWPLTYRRPITPDELDAACVFVEGQLTTLARAGAADRERTALTNLCQQLLSSNEFLYVD